ncbi:host specificity J domain protein, partial [Escherichia coli EC4437]
MVSNSDCTPKVTRRRSMFADVMVRVTGFAFVTS